MSVETPRVESFVVRFIQEAEVGLPSHRQAWHGIIVHVQSNEEKPFVKIADAVAFMSRFVPIDEPVKGQEPE